MSIATAITTAQGRVAAAYAACNEKGATMPAAGSQNLTNLASTINTISGGGGGLPGFISGAIGGKYFDVDFPDGVVKCSLSPLIDMTGRSGNSITICWGAAFVSSGAGSIAYQNSDGTGASYLLPANTNNVYVTLTFPSDYNSLRAFVIDDYLINAYVRDNTTNEYLFKGSDYVTAPTYNLPTGYTKYDYLQCDGSAYIDTGILAAPPLSMRAKIVHVSASGDYILVGARKDSGNTRFFLAAPNGGNMNLGYGSYYVSNFNLSNTYTNRYPVLIRSVLSNGYQMINYLTSNYPNEAQYNNTVSGDMNTGKTIYLFRANYSSGYHCPSGDRIYEIIFYDDTSFTHKVFHGIACTNPSNTPGMYDLISESFFPNAGSGSFTVAND